MPYEDLRLTASPEPSYEDPRLTRFTWHPIIYNTFTNTNIIIKLLWNFADKAYAVFFLRFGFLLILGGPVKILKTKVFFIYIVPILQSRSFRKLELVYVFTLMLHIHSNIIIIFGTKYNYNQAFFESISYKVHV